MRDVANEETMAEREVVGAELGKPGARAWLRELGQSALVFVFSRAVLALFVWLCGQHHRCIGTRCTDRSFFPDNMLLNGLFQWDALQYRALAERGYVAGQGFETTAPFFPGFPWTARVIGAPFGSALVGGILANWIAAVVGAVVVARLARHLLPAEVEAPRQASLLWTLGPLSFFFSVFLSESLFGCATAFVFWAAVTRRPVTFAIAGVAACLTRNSGVLVVGAGALMVWELHGQRSAISWRWVWALVLPLAGFAAFLVVQHRAFGDPFEWVAAQRRWNRYLVWPTTTFRDDWIGFPRLDPRHRNVDAMYRTQEVLAAALTLPLLFVRRRSGLPRALHLLGVATWLLPFLSHSLISYARYQAGNVYSVLALSWLLSKYPAVRPAIWWCCGLVMAWYASTFPFGVWAS